MDLTNTSLDVTPENEIPPTQSITYILDELVIITGLAGALVFLENFALLCLIAYVLKKTDLKSAQRELIVQVQFVCMNDTLIGLLLFFIGVMKVHNETRALICSYVILVSMALLLIAQADVICICAYRYYIARHLKKVATHRPNVLTMTLVTVNVCLFVISLLFFFATLRVKEIPEGKSFGCDLRNVIDSPQTLKIVSVYYAVSIVFMIAADVLCIMTIRRLRRETNATAPSDGSAPESTTSSTLQKETGLKVSRRHQQGAIVTMFFILLCLNLSYTPILFAYTMALFGFPVTASMFRGTVVCMYLNSLFNPIIIAYRVRDLRGVIRQIFVCSVFSRLSVTNILV